MHQELTAKLRDSLERSGARTFLERHEFYVVARHQLALIVADGAGLDSPRVGADARAQLEEAIEEIENEQLKSIPEETGPLSGKKMAFLFNRRLAFALSALAIIAMIVWGATNLFSANNALTENQIFSAPMPLALIGKQGEKVEVSADGSFVTLLSTSPDRAATGQTSGAHIKLAEAVEKAVGGQLVTVTIRARSSAANGAKKLFAAYSTAAAGSSGWQEFSLGSEFSDFSFSYRVPAPTGDPGFDYLGFKTGFDGDGKGADIEAVQITTLN